MKVLITGIDGFVAGYLSEYLLKNDYDVYGTTIKESYKNARIKILKMNLLDVENVNNVIKNISPDMIFHLAGQSAVGLSWQKPVLTNLRIVQLKKHNHKFLKVLMELVKKHRKKLVNCM